MKMSQNTLESVTAHGPRDSGVLLERACCPVHFDVRQLVDALHDADAQECSKFCYGEVIPLQVHLVDLHHGLSCIRIGVLNFLHKKVNRKHELNVHQSTSCGSVKVIWKNRPWSLCEFTELEKEKEN